MPALILLPPVSTLLLVLSRRSKDTKKYDDTGF